MANVIARILMYHTPVLFHVLLAKMGHKVLRSLHNSTNHPTSTQSWPLQKSSSHQKLPKRSLVSCLSGIQTWLFYLTPRVKADGGKIRGRIALEAALNFHTSLSSVKRAWQKYGAQCLSLSVVDPIVVERKNGIGWKKKRNPMEIQATMKDTSFSQRRTLRSLANAINKPKSSMHRMLRLGQIKRLPCTGHLPLIHPPFVTTAVPSAVPVVADAEPAIVSSASSPANITRHDTHENNKENSDD